MSGSRVPGLNLPKGQNRIVRDIDVVSHCSNVASCPLRVLLLTHTWSFSLSQSTSLILLSLLLFREKISPRLPMEHSSASFWTQTSCPPPIALISLHASANRLQRHNLPGLYGQIKLPIRMRGRSLNVSRQLLESAAAATAVQVDCKKSDPHYDVKDLPVMVPEISI